MPPTLCEASPGTLKAYLARSFTTLVEAKISERYQVLRNPFGRAMNAEELASNALNCDYLFVSATEQASRPVFETLAGSLKAVATLSVGFNHVDIDTARAHGVAVFNSPGVLTDACAEIAMLLILNAARRAHEAEALVRSAKWPGWAPTQLLGLVLSASAWASWEWEESARKSRIVPAVLGYTSTITTEGPCRVARRRVLCTTALRKACSG
jgi:lactate dehydrogenase-like 2-hydroxyacid dehydrogenase